MACFFSWHGQCPPTGLEWRFWGWGIWKYDLSTLRLLLPLGLHRPGRVLGNEWGRGDFPWWLHKSGRQIRQRSMSFDGYTTFWWLQDRMATRNLKYFQMPQDLDSNRSCIYVWSAVVCACVRSRSRVCYSVPARLRLLQIWDRSFTAPASLEPTPILSCIL
jgi:hypothetical protein